jgi:hypothetical protein
MAEVHQRLSGRKDGEPSLVLRRLDAFIAAAEALLEAWDPVLERGGYPRTFPSFDELMVDLRTWRDFAADAAVVETSHVEPLDFTDSTALHKWLDAVDCATHDALAAGDDATRPPGRRVLGRAMARTHVLEARHQLLCLFEAAKRGAPEKPAAGGG